MIKILTLEEAKRVWDQTIITLENSTYYQSVEYAEAYSNNCEVNFVYTNDSNKKIYGFVKIEEDQVKIPFGPITSSNVTAEDLMQFVTECI